MNQEINIAPNTDVLSLIRLGNRPSVAGATLFTEMKMIEDLGMLYPKETSKYKKHFGVFECPYCGVRFKADIVNVRLGNTKSCGCKRVIDFAGKTHGLSRTKLYGVWCAMNRRCRLDKRYYTRGISVCKEWGDDFLLFYAWSLNNGYEEGLQIDRRDNDGNYEPNNCRWVTNVVNSRNVGVSSNNTSGYKGVTKLQSSYQARITVFYKNIHIGSYKSAKDAAIAYNNYVVTHGLDHKLNKI